MYPDNSSALPMLIRVDVPDHTNAISTSLYGSTLLEVPEDISWRYESLAVVDSPMLIDSADDSFYADHFTNTVANTELLDVMNIHTWHNQGHTGQGVSVAVFDVEWLGVDWAHPELGAIQSHDCFAHPSCAIPIDSAHPIFGFERGVHGLACTEVIRDVAPDADIHVLRVLGLTSLENAVDWAIREDIDIISMSLSFFNESFYDGTGRINDLVDKLRIHDIVLVTSSGNYARNHAQGQLVDNNLDKQHDFLDTRGLPIYYTQGLWNINVLWNEFGNCGTTDINAFLYDRDGNLVAKSLRQQTPITETNPSCFPLEIVTADISVADWYFLQLEIEHSSQLPRFDIMARGGYVYQAQGEGSIVDPGTHPSAFTVGAVRIDNYLQNDIEVFSSFGPTNNDLQKPDVVAPDGIDSLAYGSKNFFGTSAATPAVAGAMAVLKSAHPTWSNYQIKEEIEKNAISSDLGIIRSQTMGHGKIRLPNTNEATTQCSGLLLIFPVLCMWFGRMQRVQIPK